MSRAAARPAEASFDAGWLAQREPFDVRARDVAARSLRPGPRLTAWRAAGSRPDAARPWRVIDLACGTGANLRWLAPRLGGPQQWLVVDHDPELLARWPTLAGLQHAGGDRLRHAGPAFEARIVRRRVDLADGLESLPWRAADLVTASALLDLVGAGWIERLAHIAAAERVALLFALSVDGRDRWSTPDPDDGVVASRFAAHQRRDKGFGPALGPRAADALDAALRLAGFRVWRSRSDWVLDGAADPAARALQRTLIDGLAAAATAQDPDAGATVATWRVRRRAVAATGALRIGHVDLLALPPPPG